MSRLVVPTFVILACGIFAIVASTRFRGLADQMTRRENANLKSQNADLQVQITNVNNQLTDRFNNMMMTIIPGAIVDPLFGFRNGRPVRINANRGAPIVVPSGRYVMLDVRSPIPGVTYSWYFRANETGASYDEDSLDPAKDVNDSMKIHATDGVVDRNLNYVTDTIWIKSTDNRGDLHVLAWWELK